MEAGEAGGERDGRDRGEGRDAADFDPGAGFGGDTGLGGSRGMGRADVSASTRGVPGESFGDWGEYAGNGQFGPSYGSVLSRNLEQQGRQFGENYGGFLGGLIGGISPVPGGGLLGTIAGKSLGPSIGAAVGRSQYDAMAPGSPGARGESTGPGPSTGEIGQVDPMNKSDDESLASLQRLRASLYDNPQGFGMGGAQGGLYNDSFARSVFGAGPQQRRM